MTVGKLEKNYVTLTVSLEGCPSATACACNFKTAATTEDNSSTSSIPDQQIYGSITSPWASAHSALTADVKITGLSSGTPYTTTATCADAQPIGDGVISSLYSYTSEVDRPSKPEQLRVKQQDDNYQLSWNAPKLPGGNPNNITYYVSVWTTVDKNGNGGTIVDKDYKTNLTTYSTTAKFTSGERSRFEIKACQIMLTSTLIDSFYDPVCQFTSEYGLHEQLSIILAIQYDITRHV
ncbi:unnamed protein product [Didymodactylos carnosus]|uniref:Fibronectin type-III domain-containing protein n=1 Tax=Didymodactylos carnosus TaxID=1234261 RepID=A0A813WTR6_9BILA|nr:unnamed protein product [Didymodactylos carnosus]CAF0857089.1 unnamed protein product [Didymodactylos carnosus]CAF3537672.1 unnamed protein product [Didymodactylos carnosus]CAF3644804.1 unnamed protein product [Didymodactylos carnosus]